MADFPDYFLPRPPMALSLAIESSFDKLLDGQTGGVLHYDLAAPKWQWLCWLCERRDVLLHGTGDPSIELFRPIQPTDLTEFGNRLAVYAASDGIWPIYFAILDRARYPMSLNNAAVRRHFDDGRRGDPHYFFSISAPALSQKPFRTGWIYILPRQSFVPQPMLRDGEGSIEVMQWASPTPVVPLARVAVAPEEFPFLAQLRGHDDATVAQRARADPEGFPWLD